MTIDEVEALRGYRAVREGAGVAERPDLAVLRMWGRDPVKMLQGLITNDLVGAPADRAVYAAMLTPKGRMVAELRALRNPAADGAELLILLPRAALEGTRQHLTKFVPPMFARWADASQEWRVMGVYGPGAAALLRDALGIEFATSGEDAVGAGDLEGTPLLAVRTLDAGGEDGYELLLPAASADGAREALRARGGEEVRSEALETLRVEAGRPRYGKELTEETIPTEAFESAGLMPRAVSFTKGCYTGQEVIVRIAHRGHVNRHLRGLRLGDAPPPAPRTPLFSAETRKEIGWTGTAVRSPLLGETCALGYLRREVGPGGLVRLGSADGLQVRVVGLPFERGERLEVGG